MGRTYGSGTYGSGIYPGTDWTTEMSNFKASPVLLLEVDFPTGRQYFSQSAIRFINRFYKGELISCGTFRRSMQQNLGLFEIASIEALLADTAREIIDLTTTDQIKGVLARFKLGTARLPLSSYQTIFEGKIDDFGGQNYQFRLLVRDRLWTMPPKPNTEYVTSDEFAHCLPADLGKPIPVVYGTHSVKSFGDGDGDEENDYRQLGAWPTLFVDVTSSARSFLIAGHAIKSIDEVYAFIESKGSQKLVVTTDYVAYKNGFLGSRRCAFVQLTAAGFTKLTDTNGRLGLLSVNVTGKESNGDGSGTLLSNPVTVLKDIFSNYLESPEINGAYFDAAEIIADARGYVCAGGYIEEKNTDDFIREICDSFQIRIFPDRNGKVAISIYNPISPAAVGLKMREQWEILAGSWQLDYLSDIQGAEDAQIVNSVSYTYAYHWGKKNFRGSGTNENAESITTYGPKRLTMNLFWARNSTTGNDVAQRMVTLYKNPVAHASAVVPMLGMDIELADAVSVTHGDGPDGGYDGAAFELIETIFTPQNFSVHLRSKDVSVLVGQAFFLDDETLRVLSSGTAQVTNASGNIDLSGSTVGVQIGDIIRLKNPTNEANRINAKVTGIVDGDTVSVSNTVWTNESGITYDIIPSWLTKTGNQRYGGHLCDASSGEFSNGDSGLVLS